MGGGGFGQLYFGQYAIGGAATVAPSVPVVVGSRILPVVGTTLEPVRGDQWREVGR